MDSTKTTSVISADTSSRESNNDDLVVQTSYGPVQGLKFTSTWTEQDIYSFRGIPYAQPPVGNLRFKDPIPPPKWTSTLDCTKDGATCPQSLMFEPPSLLSNMSEDCLYLNVYAPQKPGGELLPVMVWIHGGGFIGGSGIYSHYGPDFMVAERVVVVTLNYRLGAFGFLSLGTAEVPGNAGLKDQLLALKWVQKEIQQFGGNPANVTLFGESAGSASVHLHYLSPASKGLFHRVIGESGTALGSWVVRDNPEQYAVLLAKALNCSASDPDSVLSCLTAASTEKILAVQQLVRPTPQEAVGGSILIFTPTIDKNSTEPFLPDYPKNLIQQQKGSFVPFIMGINSDEGMMSIPQNEEGVTNITNNLEYVIPSEVRDSSSKARLEELVLRLKQFYFSTPPSYSNLRGFVDLYTDVMFGYSTAQSARAFRDRANVYLYYFAYNGAFKENITKHMEKQFNYSGVSHAEEMSYLFVRQKVNQTAPEDSNEMRTWRRMVRMWTNFAKYGTPTAETDPLLQNITWKPVEKVSTRYLHIDVNLTMEGEDFLASRVALWDSITSSSSLYLQTTGMLLAASAILYMTK